MAITCPRCNYRVNATDRWCMHCQFPLGNRQNAGPPASASTAQPRSVQPASRTGAPSRAGGWVNAPSSVQAGETMIVGESPDSPTGTSVVLVDVSGSMGWAMAGHSQKIEATKQSIVSYAHTLRQTSPHVAVAIVTFASQAQTVLSPTSLQTNHREFVQAVHGLSVGDGTDQDAGLREAERVLDRATTADSNNEILEVTDGNGGRPERTARRLKNRGVKISVIAVGDANDINEPQLKEVASTVDGELCYWRVIDAASLSQKTTDVARQNVNRR